MIDLLRNIVYPRSFLISRRLTPVQKFLCVCVLTTLYLAVAGESMYRLVDGYKLIPARLTRRPPVIAAVTNEPSAFQRQMLDAATFDRGIKPRWFFAAPSPLDKPINKELATRSVQGMEGGIENYVWNEYYLKHPDENLIELLKQVKADDIFAFSAYDSSRFPRYRFVPDAQSNLGVTNNLGWIASDVTVQKPYNTVRIGMIGDSTLFNLVGRYLQSYLNSWAHARHPQLRFEVLNAARQGLAMADLINVLRYELGPMSLDYVYEYKGPLIDYSGLVKLPLGGVFGHPDKPSNRIGQTVKAMLSPLLPWSALANHVAENFMNELPDSLLWEPSKPPAQIVLPANFDEFAPSVSSARALPFWGQKLAEFDDFKRTAADIDAVPLVSTERWYVPPGGPLHQVPNRLLFDKINGAEFWPLTYQEIRRMLSLNNRIITTWAHENSVTLVDIDRLVPFRSELYWDGAHDYELGQRLRAWIIFQSLLPLIERDLIAGRIPRPGRQVGPEHPYIKSPPLRVARVPLLQSYDARIKSDPAWLQENAKPAIAIDETRLRPRDVVLAKLAPADAGATVTGTSPVIVTTTTRALGYAAIMPIPAEAKRNGPAIVEVTLRVTRGKIGVGLLSNDQGKFVSYTPAVASDMPVTVKFHLPSLDDVGFLLISNSQDKEGFPSTVEIDSLKFRQYDQ